MFVILDSTQLKVAVELLVRLICIQEILGLNLDLGIPVGFWHCSSLPASKCQRQNLKLWHDCFLPCPFKFITLILLRPSICLSMNYSFIIPTILLDRKGFRLHILLLELWSSACIKSLEICNYCFKIKSYWN